VKSDDVYVDEKGRKGDQNEDADAASLVDDSLEEQSHDAEISQGHRQQKQEIIQERLIRNQLNQRSTEGAKPVSKEKDRSQKSQKEVTKATVQVAKKTDDSKDEEVGNKAFNPLAGNQSHKKIIVTKRG